MAGRNSRDSGGPTNLLDVSDELFLRVEGSLTAGPPTAELVPSIKPLVTGLVFYVRAAVCFRYLMGTKGGDYATINVMYLY